MARTDTPGSMNFFGLRGAFGRGGSKPSGSSSAYPRSNVRITTAPPTRPRPAVKSSAPKPVVVKPKTSAKVAERAKPVKKRRVMVSSSTAKFDYRTGEVVWTKQKSVPLKIGKAPKPAKPMAKTSPKKKKK